MVQSEVWGTSFPCQWFHEILTLEWLLNSTIFWSSFCLGEGSRSGEEICLEPSPNNSMFRFEACLDVGAPLIVLHMLLILHLAKLSFS